MPSQPGQPRASLLPETEEARGALDDKTVIRIASFPFKVGRESRVRPFERLKSELERRIGGKRPLNDLYLLEPPTLLLHISRAHFAIDWIDGGFVLLDRGSACGTGVAAERVGANAKRSAITLNDGDRIVVGTPQSPYVFRFRIDGVDR